MLCVRFFAPFWEDMGVFLSGVGEVTGMGWGLPIKPAWAYSGTKISPLPITAETGNGLIQVSKCLNYSIPRCTGLSLSKMVVFSYNCSDYFFDYLLVTHALKVP